MYFFPESVHFQTSPPSSDLGGPINLAVAKSAVKAYRNSGQYTEDMFLLTAKWWNYFEGLPKPGKNSTKTVVFDIDDTVLSSYEEMVRIDFGYIAKLSQEYQSAHNMSAIPEMKWFYDKLVAGGYTIIFLTGREVQFLFFFGIMYR